MSIQRFLYGQSDLSTSTERKFCSLFDSKSHGLILRGDMGKDYSPVWGRGSPFMLQRTHLTILSHTRNIIAHQDTQVELRM